jgi:uncharacterized membrane protein
LIGLAKVSPGIIRITQIALTRRSRIRRNVFGFGFIAGFLPSFFRALKSLEFQTFISRKKNYFAPKAPFHPCEEEIQPRARKYLTTGVRRN